ncbi:lysophospholipid acyltransferase family protein [bacterium]|nr:lysophospholipid acyltransferase family protein [bacterium]
MNAEVPAPGARIVESAVPPEEVPEFRSRAQRRAHRRESPKAAPASKDEPLLVRLLGGAISLGFSGVASFVRVLPLEVALELGALIGTACSYVLFSRRRTARENLAVAFPDMSPRDRSRILRRSFANMGRMVVEFVRFPSTPRSELARLVAIEGKEHFDRFRAQNRGGVLALSAHLGNFEMISAVFNAIDMIPSSLIGRKVRPEAVDRIVCGLRLSHGVATIPNKDAVRDVNARLARGEGIGVVLDQNMKRGTGIFVPFFGKPASTTPGLAVMARRSKAPVFPVFMERRGTEGRHLLRILPPLVWDESADRKGALVSNTALYTKVIEDAVRRNPEEWFWFHRRWRTQPYPDDLAPAQEVSQEEGDDLA